MKIGQKTQQAAARTVAFSAALWKKWPGMLVSFLFTQSSIQQHSGRCQALYNEIISNETSNLSSSSRSRRTRLRSRSGRRTCTQILHSGTPWSGVQEMYPGLELLSPNVQCVINVECRILQIEKLCWKGADGQRQFVFGKGGTNDFLLTVWQKRQCKM